MPEYLVEVYVPRSGVADVRAAAARAHESAVRISAEGNPVRYVRAIFVPEDETCFHVFEARTTGAVRAASERAALPAERIVQSVAMQPGTSHHEGDPLRRTR
jgi:hypothetical protein